MDRWTDGLMDEWTDRGADQHSMSATKKSHIGTHIGTYIGSLIIRLNKAGYTATPVACGWAGTIFEVNPSFGQEH